MWNTRDRCKDQTKRKPSTVKHQRQMQSSDSAHNKHCETQETDAKIRLSAHQAYQALWNIRYRCKAQTQHTQSTVKHQRQMQFSDSAHTKHCETQETDAKIRLSAQQTLWNTRDTRDRCKAQTQRTPSIPITVKNQRQMQRSDSAYTKHCETPEIDSKLRLSTHQAHQALWNTRDRGKAQTQRTPNTVKQQRKVQRADSAQTKHTNHFETPETDAKIRIRAHQALWNTRDRWKDQTQWTPSTVKHQRQMERSDSAHTKHCETPETDAKITITAHQAHQALWNTRDTRKRCKAQTQRTPSTPSNVKNQRQMQRSDSAHTKHCETPETEAKIRLSTHQAHQTLWNNTDRCKAQTQRTASIVKHQRQMQNTDSADTKQTKHCETPETDAKLRLNAHQALWNARDRCKYQTQHTSSTPSTVKHQRQMQSSDSAHTKYSETPETDAKLRLNAHQAHQTLWNTRDRCKDQTQRTPNTQSTVKHQRQMRSSDSAHTKHCETPETDAKIRLSKHQVLWNTRDRCKAQTQCTPSTPSTVKHQRQMQRSDSAHNKHTNHCETPETDAKIRLSSHKILRNTTDRCKAQTQCTPNTVKHLRQM